MQSPVQKAARAGAPTERARALKSETEDGAVADAIIDELYTLSTLLDVIALAIEGFTERHLDPGPARVDCGSIGSVLKTAVERADGLIDVAEKNADGENEGGVMTALENWLALPTASAEHDGGFDVDFRLRRARDLAQCLNLAAQELPFMRERESIVANVTFLIQADVDEALSAMHERAKQIGDKG